MSSKINQQFLAGENIYLRGVEEHDLNPTYQSWFNDAEVCQYNSHHRFPNYRQSMQQYYDEVIKDNRHLVLAIVDKKTDTHIGNISLHDINLIDRNAEFAIVVGNKQFWGRGVGQEAGRLIVKHGFRSLNLHRIYCGTNEDNIGMQKLAVALGFKKEGTAREAILKGGNYRAIIYYGLLKSEFA